MEGDQAQSTHKPLRMCLGEGQGVQAALPWISGKCSVSDGDDVDDDGSGRETLKSSTTSLDTLGEPPTLETEDYHCFILFLDVFSPLRASRGQVPSEWNVF